MYLISFHGYSLIDSILPALSVANACAFVELAWIDSFGTSMTEVSRVKRLWQVTLSVFFKYVFGIDRGD